MNLLGVMPDNDVLMLVADWVIRLRKAATCRRELMTRWESNRQMREITSRKGLLHEGRALLMCRLRSLSGRNGFYRPQLWRSGSNFSNLTDNSSAPLIMSDTLNTKYFICGIRIYPQPSALPEWYQPHYDEYAMRLYSSFIKIKELCLKKGWKPPFSLVGEQEMYNSGVRFLMNNEGEI
jgi:hypothetical protein